MLSEAGNSAVLKSTTQPIESGMKRDRKWISALPYELGNLSLRRRFNVARQRSAVT